MTFFSANSCKKLFKLIFTDLIMVKIDKEKCIGCGTCSMLCPEIFEIGEEGKAKIKSEKDSPCIKEAIENCPVEAIK